MNIVTACNRKQILFVIPRMGSGGAERVVSLLANSLAANNYKVTVVTLAGGPSFYPLNPPVTYIPGNINVKRGNWFKAYCSELFALPRAFMFLRRTITQGKFDRVVSFLPETDILVFACKLSGLQFSHICSERTDPTRRPWWRRHLLHYVHRRVTLLICQTQTVADYYKNVPLVRKKVIANPVALSRLPQSSNCINTRIVAVGRLAPEKNFSLLISAFSQICKEFPQYRLDIYGEGPLHAKLQQQIDLLGLQNKITLKGRTSNVLHQIADAALFVLPSNFEGFPNALLEAIALGLPVISTDFATGAARELVGPENGLLIPVGDQNALAKAMRTILSDPTRQHAMRQANMQKAKKYDVNIIIQQWEKVIA